MSTLLNQQAASSQYAYRPKDERFSSLAALVSAAEYDRDHSVERTYNLRDLRAVEVPAADLAPSAPGTATPLRTTIQLESPKGRAAFTHWSFGQLARTIGAPAAYLRDLPPAIAADAINYGLRDADHTAGKRANLLVRANGGTPIVRAATSDTYGRVWDAELYSVLGRYFGDGARSSQGEWQSPPTWSGENAGQYRGDRDSFVIRIDGGSIVGDPRGFSGGGNGRLNRGILVRNSEVGHCSITLECILFDFICGNHILWGAVIDRTFRRRHVGTEITQKTLSEILQIARRYNSRSASEDEAIIKTLTQHEIAHTKEAVIDELKKLGYSVKQATEAYDTCEAKDPQLNPRSFWGVMAGTTRASQEAGYQDDRLALDQLAAAVLKKGRTLVTV
jgi:hypothetical protein